VFVGLTTVDMIHRVAGAVGVNQKVTALSQEIVAGGPATNAAVTFALLGGDAVLVTDLGAHPLAGLARTDLERWGVQVRAVQPESPTIPAVSSIRVVDDTGDRSVVSVNAAARTVAAPSWLRDVLDDADVLLLDGHHPVLTVAAARAARDRGIPVVLDAGSWKPVLDELLPLVDVAVCSADFRVPGGSDPATALLGRGVPRVAISRGADPLLWWSAEHDGSGRVPVPAARVRDTLGAGDVLHGAFAWELARSELDFPEQLARSAAVASDRCTHVGISSWRNHLRNRRG
jgi:sugar/nucleoside kinase (ribokinase family)